MPRCTWIVLLLACAEGPAPRPRTVEATLIQGRPVRLGDLRFVLRRVHSSADVTVSVNGAPQRVAVPGSRELGGHDVRMIRTGTDPASRLPTLTIRIDPPLVSFAYGEDVPLREGAPVRIGAVRVRFGGIVYGETPEGCSSSALLYVDGVEVSPGIPGTRSLPGHTVHVLGSGSDEHGERAVTVRVERSAGHR